MSHIKTFSLEEEFKKHPELLESDLQLLREWCQKQPHLPKVPDSWLALFLHSNYYRLEPTKNTIENFFTARTHVPEFFANRDPLGSKGLRKAFTVAANLELDLMTKEGYKVMFGRFVDTNPANYDFNDCTKYFLMVGDLAVLTGGIREGYIYLADSTGLSLGHAGRLNPMGLRKFLYYIQEAAPIRLKGLHFLNAPPALEVILNMMKPFMKKEMLSLIHFHSNLKTLEPYVPIEGLPNEVGGKAGPIMDMLDAQIKKIEDNREWYIEEERTYRVNESLRVGKSKSAGDLFGVEGSFKKLDID